MSAPQRIQRKRERGWRMPPGAVYVGRPTKWGNPFSVGQWDDRLGRRIADVAEAVALFRERCLAFTGTYNGAPTVYEPLRGKDLACWCPLDRPCHADVLLEWANREVAS